MARRFGLEEPVEVALWAIFERWDGHGGPRGLRGEQIPLAARFAAVAYAAVIFTDLGSDAAVETVRRWSGRILDPDVADAFAGQGRELLQELERIDDLHVAVVAAEPGLRRTVTEGQLDQVARGFADVVDLKSPYLHGHSAGVAELAEAAARLLGMPDREVVAVRRAGLFHDLGRAGVPTGLWDKPGPLSRSDWEQVRLHPYHTERILGRAPMLAPVGRLAGAHHERLDGSGYHRGTPAQLLGMDARVLAAPTVHTHVSHIYDKAGVSTRAGAAVFAMEHGLVHPDHLNRE